VKASPLTKTIRCKKDNLDRIIVLNDCSIPENKNIFVIGDTANFKPKGKLSKKYNSLPGVAQVALQMGKHVAKQIINDINGLKRNDFIYKDLGEMATIGKSKAVVDILDLRFGGLSAWLIWLFVHLIAITNFKNKLKDYLQKDKDNILFSNDLSEIQNILTELNNNEIVLIEDLVTYKINLDDILDKCEKILEYKLHDDIKNDITSDTDYNISKFMNIFY
jgi:hypothetical protein